MMMNKKCELNLQDLLEIGNLTKKVISENNTKTNLLYGDNISRSLGRGMEYAESRIYQPGDDIRHIDWRLTAKYNRTYTKLYHEEKGEEINIILDLSNNMYFGTNTSLKSITACKVAALLSWHAYYQNNNLGGIVFNNNNLELIKPKNTKNNLLHILNQISKQHNPNLINSNINRYTLLSAVNTFEKINKKNCNLYIISDFFNLDELVCNKIQKLNYKNNVFLIRIADLIEKNELPTGKYAISNGEQNTLISINNNNKSLFKNFFANKIKSYRSLVKKYRIYHQEIFSEPKWYNKIYTLLK